MLISVSQDTVVSNKHEERTRHYYVIFQHPVLRWHQLTPFLGKISLILLRTTLMWLLSQTQLSSKPLTSPLHAISSPLPLPIPLF